MLKENYKTETKKAYNNFPDDFNTKFELYLQKYLQKEVREFLKRLPHGSKILDIGAGTGNHALYFQKQSHKVFCIDFSEEMLRICKEKGLDIVLMDFEDMKFPENSFDGVWAYTSLLHTPKRNLEKILKQIVGLMKPSGIFFLGMKYGSGEGFRIQEKYPETKRWFSLYTDEELREILEPIFEIQFSSETKIDETHIFLNYILIKK